MGMQEDIQMLQFLQQQQMANQGQQPQGGQPITQTPPFVPGQQGQDAMQQQQAPSNPMMKGSQDAIEAAKRSLEMNPREERRAMGRALIGMMSGMGQNAQRGHGLAGNLGAINAGFMPAMNAYDAERDRIIQMNHMLQLQQMEEKRQAAKEAREMEKMKQAAEVEKQHMEIAHQRLGLEQGYYGLKKQEVDDENKEWELLGSGEGKVPLSRFKSPSMQKYAQTYIDKKTEEGNHAANLINNVSRLEEIYRRNPHISSKISSIMLDRQNEDPGYLKQTLITMGIPPNQRADYEMAAKYSANLKIDAIKSLGTIRGNMFIEKLISSGTPGVGLSGQANLKLLNEMKKEAKHAYEDGHRVYSAYEEGYLQKVKPRNVLILEDEAAQQGHSELSDISTKDIKRELGLTGVGGPDIPDGHNSYGIGLDDMSTEEIKRELGIR